MAQGVVKIRNKDYKTVALRVTEFRESHPIDIGWGVNTSVLQCTADGVLVRAEIVNPEGKIVATGHAQEVWEGQINATSAVENCETSAIGRALASAGLGGEEFASANEVQHAVAQQERGHTNKPPAKPKETEKLPSDKLLAGAEKLYSQCHSKDELLAALDRVAEGREKFPDDDTFRRAINAVLNHTQALSDEDVLHVNRKCSFLLLKQPGVMTAAELEQEAETAFN